MTFLTRHSLQVSKSTHSPKKCKSADHWTHRFIISTLSILILCPSLLQMLVDRLAENEKKPQAIERNHWRQKKIRPKNIGATEAYGIQKTVLKWKRERLVTYENIHKQRTSEMVKRWNASHIDTEVSQHVQIFIQVQFLLCLSYKISTFKNVYRQWSLWCAKEQEMGLKGGDRECASPHLSLFKCHVKSMKVNNETNRKVRSKG